MTELNLESAVSNAINSWEQWLPKWEPQKHRGRIRICRRCTGSPLALAAGMNDSVPHQVVHALLTRMHRVIDNEVDRYTREHLPLLYAELNNAAMWKSGGYDPKAGLPDEIAGIDPDLLYEEGEHPVLFTFAELQASEHQEVMLPLPPLSQEEKQQLRKEMQIADARANQIGSEVCFLLSAQKHRIKSAILRFVEPQIQQLLDELSQSLESPTN